MIIKNIMDLIFGLLYLILNIMPALGIIQFPSEFVVWFSNIIAMSAYFFPVGDFLLMLGIWLVIANFHFMWKLITRVWDALPFT